MEVSREKKLQFILVHGACHGAWSWYKVKPQLEAVGHKVNAIDLSGAGINTRKMEEIRSLYDYSQPLMDLLETIPPDEKVILVGHSFGGFSLALAADKYPDKVSVAVFVAAFMPDSEHVPSYVYTKRLEEHQAKGGDDMTIIPYGSEDKPQISVVFSPNYLASRLYQLCSPQDLALAKMLVRPIPAQSIMEDMSSGYTFSKEGYGAVKKVYIICNQDKTLMEDFQRWEIENNHISEVMEIKDADHMPMFSKTQQLSEFLLEIAHRYT